MTRAADPTGGRPLAACEEALHAAARRDAGLEDFGPDDYREGLRRLLRSWDEDADLAPEGRAGAFEVARAALAGRLHSQAAWGRHPECLVHEIRRPLFVIGLARTGTTALHHLLACDPAVQGLELWLLAAPRPRPPRAAWERDPQYRACADELAARFAAQPGLRAIHEMAADAPDECWRLFHQTFASVTFECISPVASYTRWWLGCDMRAAYARHRDHLRLIGAREPARRWVLKDPSHLFHLEALLDAFPDACFVWTHRDPVRAIPSVCSLNLAFRLPDRARDPKRHGEAQLELWGTGLDRTLAMRRRLGSARFLDIEQREIAADPLGVARRIGDHFGFELRPEALGAMRRHGDANPRGRHGEHAYRPEDYGLSAGRIRDRFADYLAAYPEVASASER
jgi:hypothetical protein